MTDPQQRTPEWFAQRVGRVTGSMVGAILGLSPFMTRADAMRSMVRAALGAESEFAGNIATEYGTANEPNALFSFQMQTGISVRPAPFITYEDWLGASPDGFTSDGGLVELKCPFGLRKEASPIFKAPHEQPHYVAQMQVQMFVTATSHCHFFQWSAHGTSLHRVAYDPAWINENLPKLRQFHAEFLDEVKDNAAEHLVPKRVVIDTPEAARMVREWEELAEQIERANERKKDLLAEMVTLAKGKNALIGGRKLSLTQREGAISYGKAIKVLCPDADLEPYRGKASSFWGVK